MSNRTWISEHGKDYAVPEAVLRLFRDWSWHNETCPRFGVGDVDVNLLTLWVDHPVAEQREVEGGRYLVCTATVSTEVPDVTVYEGDSMSKAITAALTIARDKFNALLSTEQLFFLEHGHLKPGASEVCVSMTENERLLLGALRKLRLEATHYCETGIGKAHLMNALKESMDILMQVSKNHGPEALLGERIDTVEANDPRIDRGRP
jgi:hypothetical protein